MTNAPQPPTPALDRTNSDMLIDALSVSDSIQFRRADGSYIGSYSAAEVLRRLSLPQPPAPDDELVRGFRCRLCLCRWRLNADGSWSIWNGDYWPCDKCNNSPEFLSLLDPPISVALARLLTARDELWQNTEDMEKRIATLEAKLREAEADMDAYRDGIAELCKQYREAPGLPLDDPVHPPLPADLEKWTNFLTGLGMWLGTFDDAALDSAGEGRKE